MSPLSRASGRGPQSHFLQCECKAWIYFRTTAWGCGFSSRNQQSVMGLLGLGVIRSAFTTPLLIALRRGKPETRSSPGLQLSFRLYFPQLAFLHLNTPTNTRLTGKVQVCKKSFSECARDLMRSLSSYRENDGSVRQPAQRIPQFIDTRRMNDQLSLSVIA